MERPYDRFIETSAWRVVAEALDQLVANADVTVSTDNYYVVGFLVQELTTAKLIASEPTS